MLALSGFVAADLGVNVQSDGSYSVSVSGEQWLSSGPTYVVIGGTRYSSTDGSLVLGAITKQDGHDPQLGPYRGTELEWRAGKTTMLTSMRLHDGGSVASFVTNFPEGIPQTGALAAEWNELLTSFPSFVQGPPPGVGDAASGLGYLTFSGRFIEASRAGSWDGTKNGPLMDKLPSDPLDKLSSDPRDGSDGSLPSGAGAGPYAVFSRKLLDTLVVSPFDNFMASSFHPEPLQGGGTAYCSGLMGSLAALPANHTSRFIVHLGGSAGAQYPGVGGAVKSWGEAMLKAYSKDAAAARAADYSLSHLGYSTDNGAFYYRGPEHGKNYEDTVLDVHAYAAKTGIPYRYILLDSWWYFKGEAGGVKQWTPRPDVFPSGLESLYAKTGWRTQLHNRYWANDTVYAKQSGGRYDFVVEPANKLAIPLNQAFWDALLANASAWGLAVYEQDWLYNEFNGLNATRQNLTLARDWLVQMGRGAAAANATVQYCMTYARMLLQSIEVPAGSQFRASDDYGPGQSAGCGFPYCVYNIGTTSILAWALGLAPSKDNFWSTPQPGGAYGNHTEPFNAMQAAISAYSTGPVQPSDALNQSDVTLILSTCTATSGTLLQPSRPAAAIDACLAQEAFGEGGPRAVRQYNYPVWSTHTAVPYGGDALRHAHVLVIALAAPFALAPSHLPLDIDSPAVVEHVAWLTFPANRSRGPLQPFSESTPLQLAPNLFADTAVAHISPIVPLTPLVESAAFVAPRAAAGFVLLGEKGKLVPISVHRFVSLLPSARGSDVVVSLRGDPSEVVEVEFATRAAPSAEWTLGSVKCVIGAGGTAIAQLIGGTCAPAGASR